MPTVGLKLPAADNRLLIAAVRRVTSGRKELWVGETYESVCKNVVALLTMLLSILLSTTHC